MSFERRQIQTLRPEDPDEEKIVNFRLSEEDFERAKEVREEGKAKYLEALEAKKVEMTERQRLMVDLANGEVEDVRREYSPYRTFGIFRKEIAVFPLYAKDYKLLADGLAEPEQETKPNQLPDGAGVYNPQMDSIVLWYKKNSEKREDHRCQEILNTVSHLMIHAMSYRAMQAYKEKPEGEASVEEYRVGLSMVRLGGKEGGYFHDLNEAMVETLSTEITNRVVDQNREIFGEMILDQIRHFMDRAMTQMSSKLPGVLQMKETLKKNGYLDDPDRRSPGKKDAMAKKILDEGYAYEYPSQYQWRGKERAVFRQLVSALAEKSEKYKGDEDGARRLFFEAAFTGEMLELGREIEKTFGKGTFRVIAEGLLSEDLQRRIKGGTEAERS